MQVYDTANRLAQEIKESEEYKAYKKLSIILNINAIKTVFILTVQKYAAYHQ